MSSSACCSGDHRYEECTFTRPGENEVANSDDIEDEEFPALETILEEDDNGLEANTTDIGVLWEDVLMTRLAEVLSECQPFPGDGLAVNPTYRVGDNRFVISRRDLEVFEIYDRLQGFEAHISIAYLQWEGFSVGKWFAE